jgi:DNA-binding NarL/FixJ family response regulator
VTIRVLIVDDQPLMRAAFEMTLSSEDDIELVGQASDGQEAIEMARALHPDVVLMDIRMPKLDGVEATRVLAAENDAIKVLILTTFDIDEYVLEALRAGASGFLLKDVRADELVRAIRVVADGETLLAPSVTRRLIETFIELRPPGPDQAVELEVLTPAERTVLTLIGRGSSNSEIAAELSVADTTVRTHVRHIFEKLGLRDRVQAVVLAYRTGLVRPTPAASHLAPRAAPEESSQGTTPGRPAG